jgi:hypothetical protein
MRIILRLSVVPVLFLLSASLQAAPACFTPSEAAAANLRVLQQHFNVAALNCQLSDPSVPGFAERYNRFVGQFSAQLQENGAVLSRHFAKDKTGFDRWMTRIANQAGQSVVTKPDFCQLAWDRLERILALPPGEIEAYAVETAVAAEFAPRCPEKRQQEKRK